MAICIDRNDNIILNVGGVAHRTGFVIVRDENKQRVGVARGQGFYARGCHITEWVFPVYRTTEPLTPAAFCALTGYHTTQKG